MIMVKISAWGSPNHQYRHGVAGQKGWETLIYAHETIIISYFLIFLQIC